MHKYNNQDHSMLTAMVAVENIIAGREEKDAIWQVNTEMEYHESKETSPALIAHNCPSRTQVASAGTAAPAASAKDLRE